MTIRDIGQGAWTFLIWTAIAVVVITLVSAVVQVSGLRSLHRMETGIVIIGEDVIENRRKIAVIEDTLRNRTFRFYVISEQLALASVKIDTLTTRVERLRGR
jgi:hypothetical protein